MRWLGDGGADAGADSAGAEAVSALRIKVEGSFSNGIEGESVWSGI